MPERRAWPPCTVVEADWVSDKAAIQAAKLGKRVAAVGAFQANMVDYGERIGTSPELIALFEREITDSIETITAAFRAGVPLLTGSESGFSLVPYGDWHYRELEVFVRYFGLTPLQAIRCATLEGARALRMEGRVGEGLSRGPGRKGGG